MTAKPPMSRIKNRRVARSKCRSIVRRIGAPKMRRIAATVKKRADRPMRLTPMKGQNIVARELGDSLRIAGDRALQGMARIEKRAKCLGHDPTRIHPPLPNLREHPSPFPLQFGGVELRLLQHLGEQGQATLAVLGEQRQRDCAGGPPDIDSQPRAEKIELFGDRRGGAVLRPLIEQPAGQIRKSGLVLWVMGRADWNPHTDMEQRELVVLDDHDAEAVGQNDLRGGDLQGSGSGGYAHRHPDHTGKNSHKPEVPPRQPPAGCRACQPHRGLHHLTFPSARLRGRGWDNDHHGAIVFREVRPGHTGNIMFSHLLQTIDVFIDELIGL